jgi:hypothetical protein
MKAIFETLREVVITLVIVLGVAALAVAIFQPGVFAKRLAHIMSSFEDEGFDVKLKTPFADADFERLTGEVKETDVELLAARQRVIDLTSILAALRARTEQEGAVLPEPTDQPVLVAMPQPWVVIAGSETDLDSQRNELRLLQRSGFTDAVILKSGPWYQSSVIYPDQEAAETGLAEVTEIVGTKRGAYIRALNILCPDMAEVAGQTDVFSCN